MPATLANTFLFILQNSALADLTYGGTFYGTLCHSLPHYCVWTTLDRLTLCCVCSLFDRILSATVKELLKPDSICQSYAQMKKGPVIFDLQCRLGVGLTKSNWKWHHSIDRIRVIFRLLL